MERGTFTGYGRFYASIGPLSLHYQKFSMVYPKNREKTIDKAKKLDLYFY
ncbi:hypothetical protein Holit_02497 [Hollandina sp. SP2]